MRNFLFERGCIEGESHIQLGSLTGNNILSIVLLLGDEEPLRWRALSVAALQPLDVRVLLI